MVTDWVLHFLDGEWSKVSTLIMSIQHFVWSSLQGNKEGGKIKGIWTGKEEIQPTLFAEGVMVSIESPKDFAKESLGILKEAARSNKWD